jgi:hypothetical protein
MSKQNPKRKPAGVPSGGQFAAKSNPESDVTLDSAYAAHPSRLPSLEAIASADADRLWAYIHHSEPLVRADAANNLAVTHDQLDQLADPAVQPFEVRASVARLLYPGVANRAASDPDPVVRAIALDGWDLTNTVRDELERDEVVQRVRRMLAMSRV